MVGARVMHLPLISFRKLLYIIYISCIVLANGVVGEDRLDITYEVTSSASLDQTKDEWLALCKKDYPDVLLTRDDIVHYVVGLNDQGKKTLTVSLLYEKMVKKGTDPVKVSAWVGAVGCDDGSMIQLKTLLGPEIYVEKMPESIAYSQNILLEAGWKNMAEKYPGLPFYHVECMAGGVYWQAPTVPSVMCSWEAHCFPLKNKHAEHEVEDVTVFIPLYHGRQAANALIALHQIQGVYAVEIIGAQMGTYTFALQLEGIHVEDIPLWHRVREVQKGVYEVDWLDNDAELVQG